MSDKSQTTERAGRAKNGMKEAKLHAKCCQLVERNDRDDDHRMTLEKSS